MRENQPTKLLPNLPQERAYALNQPYLCAGIERYGRVASSLGVESRHPFLDRRLIAFALTLPGEQKFAKGWPKAVLRRAMANHLPDATRWRRGKQHLGWVFTTALMKIMRSHMNFELSKGEAVFARYVNAEKVKKSDQTYSSIDDPEETRSVYDVAHLSAWLSRFADRPQVNHSYDTLSF